MNGPYGANLLVAAVRRRTRDLNPTTPKWTDAEILETCGFALGQYFTKMRNAGVGHEETVLTLTQANLTPVTGQRFVYDYTLPEWVADVHTLKPRGAAGIEARPIEQVPREIIGGSFSYPVFTLIGGRPGTLRIHGNLGRVSFLDVWYTREWAPLHFGTAQAGGASTITFAAAPTGRLLRRTDIYVGMDVIVTNQLPSTNVEGQIRRVTAFDSTTLIATVDIPWTVVPTSATTYAIVLPIRPEYHELIVEETAQILREEIGEAMPSIRLKMLRDTFEDGIAQRSHGQPKGFWNSGA